MQIFSQLDQLPADLGPSVISIGNFDGVHCAHEHVLRQVVLRARELQARAIAVTFDPHPLRLLRPEAAPKLITPMPLKLRLLEASGVDAVVVIPFTTEFSKKTPREFAEEIIARRLRALEVHEGANFHFGHKAEGTVEKLAEFGDQFGFAVKVYPEMRIRGEVVSSSSIRQIISQGNVSRVRALLGRNFGILGTPAKGRGYGARYTVPTINLAPYPELAPAYGVYITRTRIGAATFNSVTNVGVRPTFGEPSFAIESHLLNFHPLQVDLDTEVELEFLRWIRAEMKFSGPDALLAQIRRDVKRAEHYFALERRLVARSSAPAAARH